MKTIDVQAEARVCLSEWLSNKFDEEIIKLCLQKNPPITMLELESSWSDSPNSPEPPESLSAGVAVVVRLF